MIKGFFLLVIGCVLIAVGLSLGGHMINTDKWSWNNSGGEDAIRGVVVLEETFSSPIKKLDINLKAAQLVIQTGSVAGYRATDFEKDALSITIEGDKLTVSEADWQHGINFGKNSFRPLLEITLPENVMLDECRISIGAGTINGSGIAAQKAVLKTGAGSLEFTSCKFQDTDIETGAGRFTFEGDLTSRTNIATGAGAVELSLAGKEDDYRIDFTRGLGSVKIGSNTYDGIGNGNAGNRSADRSIKLSTGLGSVDIQFEE